MHCFHRALADPLILFVNCSLDRIGAAGAALPPYHGDSSGTAV
jgi:hypothetical protein